MSTFSPLAAALSRIAQQSGQTSFNVTFNATQNTVIRRINDQIEKIVEETDSTDEVARLQKLSEQITAELPLIDAYILGNKNNRDRLVDLAPVTTAGVAAFSADDSDPDVLTADEAASVNAYRDDIAARLDELLLLTLPGVNEVFDIRKLRDASEELKLLTAEAGVVDASDTNPATNDNRALYDLLERIDSLVDIAQTNTDGALEIASEFRINLQTDLLGIEADFTRISAVDARERSERIQAVRADGANLLQVIALSFEASQGLFQYLDSSLNPATFPQGSIVNLFT